MDLFSAPRPLPAPAVMPGSLRRGGPLIIIVALGALLVIGAGAAGAQTGTPAAGVDVVDPAECTVEPRPLDELRALFREVAATPLPASLDASPVPALDLTGPPADAETVAAVNATWRQYLACLGAGDQARMFALLSDAMVRRQLEVDIAFGVTEEALFAHLTASPVPVPTDQAISFVPLGDVRALSDGRVAAVSTGDANREEVRIFVEAGDRWLLDDWYELP